MEVVNMEVVNSNSIDVKVAEAEAEVVKVANKFNSGFMDRDALTKHLCKITDGCHNTSAEKCLICPLPMAVEARIPNAIILHLKRFLHCFRHRAQTQ